MKSLLIVSLVLSTIMASESSAQTKPDTIAKTKNGTPVITLPGRTTGVVSSDVQRVAPVKPETTVVHLPGRPTPLKLAKDSAARADTVILRSLAKQRSPNPDRAWVTQLVIRGDSAFATVYTDVPGGPGLTAATLMQRVRFLRTKRAWTHIPTPLNEGGR